MRSLVSNVRAAFGGTPNSPQSGDLTFDRPESNLSDKRDAKVAEDSVIRDPDGLTFDEATRGGLGRHLGFWSTYFLIIGRIIGTGIFSTPSSITESVGSVGAALMLWVLGLALSFAGLLVWLEFGCMLPRSGGEKLYLEASYPRPRYLATIVFAFNAIFLGFTASGCIVFATNIVTAANSTIDDWQKRGIAIAVIVFVTLIHTFTPKAGVYLMNSLGFLKVFILAFIIIVGLVVLGGHVKSVPDPTASFQNSFANSSTSSNQYATALFKVLNTYTGWSNAAYVLNEVKNPVRTLKIAGPAALATCGALYLLANVAYFAVASPTEIAASGVTVAAFFMGKVFGTAAQRAMAVFVALSSLGNVLTITFAQSRVNQELAKEGVIPYQRFWASTYPSGAPTAGLFLHFIPSFIIIIAIPFGNAFNFIIDVEGYPSSIIALAVVVGLFLLRWKVPDTARPFKVWWPVAAFFLVGQCFLIVAPFIRPPGGVGDTPPIPYWLYPIVGITVLIASVVYWFVWRVVMPRVGSFEWRDIKTNLADGTVVTTFVREKEE
ncbi:hypothetical protein N0V93_005413 [Gnomoniopsis smithogilvyi]|uniref:High affinity methionine permease n=1 Tax=Gnomoniopsis smithogilvyi TaxID=1191159 RepID=A0A9W8YUP2_9PEZI|nr:hypothetical protein N0V93_005413 [Gnomoniopsis smithogilvyi]